MIYAVPVHFLSFSFLFLSSHIRSNGAVAIGQQHSEQERELTGCNAMYCRACHNERRFSGPGEWRTEGEVKGKTGAKYDAEMVGRLSRKTHSSSLRQMEIGKRQKWKRIVSTSYAWVIPERGH